MENNDFVELIKSFEDKQKLADEFRVSLGTIKRWESGRSIPHPEILRVIVKRLRVLRG